MLGIYKITNKNNGMVYIGQSIHCGKRLDEHFCGNQVIDTILREEGIENFSFEILKILNNKEQLSYWEDYYINEYSSLYPNGYNLRKNTSYTFNTDNISNNNDNNIKDDASVIKKKLDFFFIYLII